MQVHTVTGSIDVSSLGKTLVHEHLRVRSEEIVRQFPQLYDEGHELQRAIEQVRAAKQRGIQTICDPTVMGLGRDIRFMERVAQQTQMQIIAATGVYTYHYLPPALENRSIDFLADLFVHDIEQGIQGTSIKAGFLKCATDAQGITPDVEKVLRAVARAQKQTGVPILTHSHPASGTGIGQMEIFEEEGVNPKSIMIGHSGDTDSLEYLLRLLSHGSYIGMDRYGLTAPFGCSTERRNATVVELVQRGYTDRMFLSQDACATIDWFSEEMATQMFPKWTMTYVTDEILPDLLANGVTQGQIDTMMIDNVQHWFEGV
ncbi:MAG: phosphotriesterase [Firmicutes bacterium]|nr:phosphotriesterase [Bacillota bacterium]